MGAAAPAGGGHRCWSQPPCPVGPSVPRGLVDALRLWPGHLGTGRIPVTQGPGVGSCALPLRPSGRLVFVMACTPPKGALVRRCAPLISRSLRGCHPLVPSGDGIPAHRELRDDGLGASSASALGGWRYARFCRRSSARTALMGRWSSSGRRSCHLVAWSRRAVMIAALRLAVGASPA